MRIYLAMDWPCLSPERVTAGRVGGTERFFLILKRWLENAGHNVVADPQPGQASYDVAIHSNAYQAGVNASKHICWAGSWHTDAATGPYDRVLLNSAYMYGRIGRGEVLPACYEAQIPGYRTHEYVSGRIVCASNPNRYMEHALKICELLTMEGVDFEWHVSGGNKLYGDQFAEHFGASLHPRMKYAGVMDRTEQLHFFSSGHLYVYPNLTDDSETQCVAAIEAAVLGLPVLVPSREPFVSVMPGEAVFADNHEQFAAWIKHMLSVEQRIIPDLSRYSEAAVMPRFLEIIQEVVNP